MTMVYGGEENNIKTIIGGDGDANGGDSPHRHRQGGRISEEVSGACTTSPTTDGDLEGGGEDYLEVHHQFPEGVDSASSDEFHGHVLMMMKKSCEITTGEVEEAEAAETSGGAGDDDDDDGIRTANKYYCGQFHYYYVDNPNSNAKRSTSSITPTSEIVVVGDEREGEGSDFHDHPHHPGNSSSSSSYQNQNHSHSQEEDAVYVAVSSLSSSSSIDALQWTLNHTILDPSSTTVVLVHVFPQIKHIPTPLGMLPASQVNPEQKEKYMAQERGKRGEFLNKFLNACSTAKVKVDTVLIESDTEAKAILDLIPILNITKLVLGTTKANLRKMRSRKGSRGGLLVVDEIAKAAPESCEVKIICEGKEVIHLFTDSPSSRRAYISTSTPPPESSSPSAAHSQNQSHIVTRDSDSFGCGGCFKPKFRS